MVTSKSNKSQIKTKSRPRKNLHKDPKVNFYEGCKIWLEFWRKNPHRFAVDYLGFPLFTFQQILLYMMNISDYFVFIACRGLGKVELIELIKNKYKDIIYLQRKFDKFFA